MALVTPAVDVRRSVTASPPTSAGWTPSTRSRSGTTTTRDNTHFGLLLCQQRRRGRAGQRLRDASAPRHGDRHLGAARPAGAPGLPGAQRPDLPGTGAADERRHRHPALGEERQLAPDRRRRAHRPGPLHADVGGAGRESAASRPATSSSRSTEVLLRAGWCRSPVGLPRAQRRRLPSASARSDAALFAGRVAPADGEHPGRTVRPPVRRRRRRSRPGRARGALATGDAARVTGGAGQRGDGRESPPAPRSPDGLGRHVTPASPPAR